MESNNKSLIQNIFIFIIVFAATRFIFSNVLGIAVVSGNSMFPTYKNGQAVLYLRTHHLSSGDVIIIDTEDHYIIKRVIASEGDVVSLEDNVVHINGQIIDESRYLQEDTATVEQSVELPHIVSACSYFVLGDNRVVSLDSRFVEIGDISIDKINGKVIFVMAK